MGRPVPVPAIGVGTGNHLTIALLCLAPLALGAAPYLGSPWPGVVLAGLSLLPHGLEALLSLRSKEDRLADLQREVTALRMRLDEAEGDVRSLKNRAAMKG